MSKDREVLRSDEEPEGSRSDENDLDAICDIDGVEEPDKADRKSTPRNVDIVLPNRDEILLTGEMPHDKIEEGSIDFSHLAPSEELATIDGTWNSISILFSRLHNAVEVLSTRESRTVNRERAGKLKDSLDVILYDCGTFNDLLEELLQ